MTECQICYGPFNKSTNAPVTCEYGDCGYVACKNCVRTYLTTTNADPCCMKCKKQFSTAFMYENLNRSFVMKQYRDHRSQLLLDRAISQLPDAMGEVEKRVKVEDKKAVICDLQDTLRKYQHMLRTEQSALWNIQNDKSKIVKRKFVMGCQREDCRGFLSSQYKCGLCNYHTCSQCLCVKGATADAEHTCDPNDVASAELIKAQTKSCPSCGERISKIEGCDQMWCTSCNTAFSWRTGTIDTGVVHNPHFFEFQRQNAGGAHANHGRGLGQCNANNMPGYYLMRRVEDQLKKNGSDRLLINIVVRIYRIIAHIRAHEVVHYRTRIETLSNTTEIRVDYLMKRITKKEMQRKLYTNDRSRRRDSLILNLFEVIGDVGMEWVWGLCNSNESDENFVNMIDSEVKKIIELFHYCNREWAKISYDHRICVPLIAGDIRGIDCTNKCNLYKLGKAAGISTYEDERFGEWCSSLLTPMEDEKIFEL